MTLYTPMAIRTNTLQILSDSNHGAFQIFSINEIRDSGCGALQSLFQFFLYKQLSEPNTCGFERMSAMNTDISYEYTDVAMNIVSQFIISARSYLVLAAFSGSRAPMYWWRKDSLIHTARTCSASPTFLEIQEFL